MRCRHCTIQRVWISPCIRRSEKIFRRCKKAPKEGWTVNIRVLARFRSALRGLKQSRLCELVEGSGGTQSHNTLGRKQVLSKVEYFASLFDFYIINTRTKELVDSFSETHQLKTYTMSEMRNLLEDNGFQLVGFFKDFLVLLERPKLRINLHLESWPLLLQTTRSENVFTSVSVSIELDLAQGGQLNNLLHN